MLLASMRSVVSPHEQSYPIRSPRRRISRISRTYAVFHEDVAISIFHRSAYVCLLEKWRKLAVSIIFKYVPELGPSVATRTPISIKPFRVRSLLVTTGYYFHLQAALSYLLLSVGHSNSRQQWRPLIISCFAGPHDAGPPRKMITEVAAPAQPLEPRT